MSSATAGGNGSTSPSKCESCGTEKVKREWPGSKEFHYIPNCDCEYNEHMRQEKVRQEARKERDRLDERKKQLVRIPIRFRNVSFSNFTPRTAKQKKALELLRSNPKGSYLISGDYGQGKTHLLWSQYSECADGENVVYAASMHELLEIFRKKVTDQEARDPFEFAAIEDGAEGTHVFLDDIDKFKFTDFKLEALFDFIDTIYRQNVGLTMTSNSTMIELQEKLSPAIVRRIDDICTKVEL